MVEHAKPQINHINTKIQLTKENSDNNLDINFLVTDDRSIFLKPLFEINLIQFKHVVSLLNLSYSVKSENMYLFFIVCIFSFLELITGAGGKSITCDEFLLD